MQACLFGNAPERDLASLPAAICRIVTQTPESVNYFGLAHYRLRWQGS
jgi:hypothetical protein